MSACRLRQHRRHRTPLGKVPAGSFSSLIGQASGRLTDLRATVHEPPTFAVSDWRERMAGLGRRPWARYGRFCASVGLAVIASSLLVPRSAWALTCSSTGIPD